MRALLVEDDMEIAVYIVKGLKQEGIGCDHIADGSEAFRHALESRYDILIIDLMLPGMSGMQLIQRLRVCDITTPILILSAKASVEDRVRGLQQGADDYLVKPFAFSELSARLHALLRRSQANRDPEFLRVDSLQVDPVKRRIMREDVSVALQPAEYSLLVYLMQNAGRVVSKTTIMEHVWEYNFDPGTNVVEACICRLRDKVDRPFASPLIHTVRGFGYVLEKRD